MINLTFGEQVKIVLSRKDMTIKELAEEIEARTGKKMSRQNLTQRLGRDNFQEQDMRMIAKILECPFYLDILEEHEDRTEKPVKEQKAAEPEQKEAPTRAEERDITIGELVDIHKELDAIEKKKSKKKAKKVVEENPEYVQETIFDFFVNEKAEEPEVEEPEPKKTETEKKAHGWRAFFGIHKKHEESVKEEKEEEKPEIQYHEFDYSEDGESGELAEEFLPDEPEEAETYAAETETAAYENAEQLNTNYDAGHQNRYAQENEEDLFTSTEEDLEKGELNPYTGHEYESNSVRMHPNRIGYVQVYDRGTHQWTDMTEWAFLGYQERKKALLGKDYEPPIYLD